MARRIRWLGLGMVGCFFILFLQLNNLQVVKAHQYASFPKNPFVEAARDDQARGVIQSSDGVVLAQSVLSPKGSTYKYERQYPTGALFGQITGVVSPIVGSYGAEYTYSSDLESHNRPITTLGDLLTTQVVTDTVTLTLSDKLQTDAMDALAGRNGAIVVIQPQTGAIEAMYSNPSFDPNPLASLACATFETIKKEQVCTQSTAEVAFGADITKDSQGFAPFTSLAYQDHFPPGSTFKVVTTAAAYEHAPKLVTTPIQSYTCIPPHTFMGQGAQLCNDGFISCGGTIAKMLPPSCDTGYAVLGTKVGATAMTQEADSFGFNQQPPIDLPHSSNEVSDFLQPACYMDAQVYLAYSSIGQQCTIASPLQMALVAAGIANGGVVMTPHVMANIRDSLGNAVTTYHPKAWLRATSPATASAITQLMTEVVRVGTAKAVGFPPAEDVAAKTGTAQFGPENSSTTDWMIAFAPANDPQVAIAVAMPFQLRDETGALVAGPIVKKMLQDALTGQ